MFLNRMIFTKKIESVLFLLSICFLIASDIINTTPYRADLEYVAIPVFFCLLTSLFMPKKLVYVGYFYILAMALLTFISTVFSDAVHLRTGDAKFYLFLLAFIIISSVRLDLKETKFVINAYAYIALLISIWLIMSYLLGLNITLSHRATLVIMDVGKDQNYTGAFFAPAATIFFCKFLFSPQKIKNIVFLVITLLAIFFTGSRAAMLTFIICMPLAFLFAGNDVSLTKKIVYSFIIIVVGLAGYALLETSELFGRMTNVDGYTDNIRLVIWGYAMRGFFEHPFLGSGLYSAAYYSQQYVRWVTHNSFIDILVGQGIVGSLLLCAVFYRFLKDCGSHNRIFIVVMIISFFLPYYFLNGYETLSFWLPMILVKLVSDGCANIKYEQLLQ